MRAHGTIEAQDLARIIQRLLALEATRRAVIAHLAKHRIAVNHFIHDEQIVELPDDMTIEEAVLIRAELEMLFAPSP